MVDLIVIVVLVVILGVAGGYVYKAKRGGKKCIGCPDGCSCGIKSKKEERSHCSSCHTTDKK